MIVVWIFDKNIKIKLYEDGYPGLEDFLPTRHLLTILYAPLLRIGCVINIYGVLPNRNAYSGWS